MKCPIEPLGDRIVILPQEEGEQMYGNIIVPDTGQEKPEIGKVLSLAAPIRVAEDYAEEELDGMQLAVLYNKIPKGKDIEKKLIEKWIFQSVKKAEQKNIKGKHLTPFLINEINKLSKNKTLEANKTLIINNALLAGKIAKAFSLI